jgi:dTDP-4-amino-4,6-dideoxygalactose transaminase
LNKAGISTGIHYPVALPFLKAYSRLEHRPEEFPVAYQYQGEILSLPMYPELTNQMKQFIVATLSNIHKS